MKIKKLLCCIILLLCTCVFAGCANVEYQRRIDDLGQILDKITVELDYDKLSSKGLSDEQIISLLDVVKNDIDDNFANIVKSNLSFIQQTNPALFYAIRPYIQLNDSVTRIIDPATKTYKVSYEILFKNGTQYTASEIMEYAYGATGDDDDSESSGGMETQKSDFLTKYVQKSSNFFGDVTKTTFNGQNVYEKYQTLCPQFGEDDITLTQIYGSTNYRLKSNADVVDTIEGYKCHLWEMSISKAKEFELEFYYLSPTTSSWYILALALSMSLVVALVVVFIVKTHNKKKYSEIVKSEDETEQMEE